MPPPPPLSFTRGWGRAPPLPSTSEEVVTPPPLPCALKIHSAPLLASSFAALICAPTSLAISAYTPATAPPNLFPLSLADSPTVRSNAARRSAREDALARSCTYRASRQALLWKEEEEEGENPTPHRHSRLEMREAMAGSSWGWCWLEEEEEEGGGGHYPSVRWGWGHWLAS